MNRKFAFDCITDFIFAETELHKADIILIPGSNCSQLMKKAAELYHQGLAPLILPSGGYNEKLQGYVSEWEYLYTMGLSLGIPENAILKEDKAKHTFDNAKYSWEVIKEKNLKLRNAIMVCKGYHSRRALMTYQTEFPGDVEFDICTVTDDSGISRDNWFTDEAKIEIVMQEVVKIGRYFEEEIPVFLTKQSFPFPEA